MTRLLRLLAGVTFLVCAMSMTADARQAAPAQDAPAPEPAAKPVPAELPEVVARVNGEAIGAGELQAAMAQMEARARQPVPPALRDRVFRQVLDQLIGYHLLLQESTSRRIAISDADLDARVAEIRSQFQSDEAFQQILEQQKVTLAELRTNLRQGMQIDRMLDAEAGANAKVTGEQVEDFYARNPKEFQQGERVRASHILIRVDQAADAPTRDQAHAKAAEILKQIKDGGDFSALATQHSQDPGSAPGGGDLGYFERGQMVGPFEESAFSLPSGGTSDLVETQFGYHIIKVVDKQTAGTVPLAEVRAQIEQFLQGRNREQHTEAFVNTLRDKAKIEILI